MPGMFEKDLIETVHHHLQAHPPCPPWSGNAILAVHVFSNKTVFVLKGRNFQIFSAASPRLHVRPRLSLLFDKPLVLRFFPSPACHVKLCWVTSDHKTVTQQHVLDYPRDNPRWFLHSGYLVALYPLVSSFFVSSADVHNTNSFTKFAHFINNMEKELFILLTLSSTMYAGKLIHAAF